MTSVTRTLFVLAAVTGLASCVSVTAEDEPSAYGAFLAARYAGVNRDAHGAADYYARALDLEPGNAVLTDRAFITAVIAGDLDEAAGLARQTLAAGDPSRLATLYSAADRIAARDYRETRTLIEQAPAFGPYNAFMSDLLEQWALAGSGRANEALALADETSAPGFLAGHLNLHRGMLAEFAGEYERADTAYRTAVYTSTHRGLAVDRYGEFLRRQGRREDALELYGHYLNESQGSVGGVPEYRLVTSALDAVEAGQRAPGRLNVAELTARALYGPTADLASQADFDLSIAYLRMVQRLDPRFAPVRLQLGGSLQRIGLPELALEEYARVPEGLFKAPAELDRIALLSSLGETQRAYEEAVALDARSDALEATLVHAEMSRIRGDCAGALPLYGELIETSRARGVAPNWAYEYFRASCLVELDRWDEAEAAFLAALEIAPDQPTLLNDLGYLWIERDENVDEAFDMVVRAAELQPEDGNVIDSLGWAHYQLGNYEAAVIELERAAELDPGNVTANYHLGDAYWQVGRQLEAGFQWRRALDLDPRPDQREGLEYRLEHGHPPAEDLSLFQRRPEASERYEAATASGGGEDGAGQP